MGIGVSVFLIAVGAVLAFALHVTTNGVNINMIGWILMGVGVLGILVDLLLFAPRRRTYRSDAVYEDDVVGAAPRGRRRVVQRDVDTTL